MIFKCCILLLSVTVCLGQWRCSYDRMRQCKNGLERSMENRDTNRQDMTAHCGNIRDDFNCLLRETRCRPETERQRNAATLNEARRYMKDRCDTPGGNWRDNSCFQGDGIKNCENANPLGGSFSSYSADACRKYQQFDDCVHDVVRNRCHRDDERLIGLYLTDKANDLAWNCSDSDQDSNTRYGSSSDRWSPDRYGGSSDRYGGSQDRQGGSSDRYGGSDRDRYGGSSDRYGGSDRDRYGGSSNRNYDRGYDRGHDRSDRNYGTNGASDITCCRYERCDRSRMQQCRDSLSRTIDNRMSGYQDQQKCRKARDDFNCLLWQQSCLSGGDEKDRNSDVIHRARDYFTKSCDTFGRWNENSCFKSQDMQRCENYLSNTRSGTDYEACRSYNNFKDCVSQELTNRCTREDELLQGAYLVDKAQEMSWTCTQDHMDDRNRYYPGDRRNQYDRRNDNYSPYDSNDDLPPQLDEDDIDCQRKVQPDADECERNLRETRRQLLTESNYDIKQKRTCCSARDYRSCLISAIQRVCKQYRRRVVESLLGRQQYELRSSDCQKVYENECSGSSALVIMLIHVFLGVLFAVSTFYF